MRILLAILLWAPCLFAQSPECKKILAESDNYAGQHRTPEEFAEYRREMDYQARLKVALLALLVGDEGVFVDQGFGSGFTTYLMAEMFPEIEVVGIDINPEMVQSAQAQFVRDNLLFKAGNIAKMNFAPNSVAGSYNSSSIHHVNTFEGAGYSLHEVIAAIGVQLEQIRPKGLWANRDFVISKGPARARLTLPTNDGSQDPSAPLTELSSAAFFRRFAQDFRSSVHHQGVQYEELPSVTPDTERFAIDLRTAIEFLLHKDYRKSYSAEVKEEYLYASQAQSHGILRLHNMRAIVLRPIYNFWLYKNRLHGKFVLTNENDHVLPRFPTNMLTVAEKVGPEAGVALVENHYDIVNPKYLQVRHFQNTETNEIYDVVARPTPTIDVTPYFEENGQIYVISRKNYPRPILNAHLPTPHIMDVMTGGYIPEPISFAAQEGQSPVDATLKGLATRTSLPATHRDHAIVGTSYYPSPGGIAERVIPVSLEVSPSARRHLQATPQPPFTDSGELRATEARNVLYAHQVGGAFDARLELNVYRLLKRLGRDTGLWLSNKIELTDHHDVSFKPYRWTKDPKSRKEWTETNASADFLEVRSGHFSELNSVGHELTKINLEYVIPKKVTHHTVLTLPVAKVSGEVWVGLEERSLPIPQIYGESSRLLASPAFRLPHEACHLDAAEAYALERLKKEFNVEFNGLPIPLGMDYRVSPGTTPEIIYPYVVEVTPSAKNNLKWIKRSELMAREHQLPDMQLLIALFRLDHALKDAPALP